ncbi:hypothetical protein ACFYXH_24540 [Streptomyces sp. NPDC002730]|uniref:hypothetical protein n=1 Tax=Streptomyces sp. NPDC002730 TaxID=3364662 RepID=UPI00368DABF9
MRAAVAGAKDHTMVALTDVELDVKALGHASFAEAAVETCVNSPTPLALPLP